TSASLRAQVLRSSSRAFMALSRLLGIDSYSLVGLQGGFDLLSKVACGEDAITSVLLCVYPNFGHCSHVIRLERQSQLQMGVRYSDLASGGIGRIAPENEAVHRNRPVSRGYHDQVELLE